MTLCKNVLSWLIVFSFSPVFASETGSPFLDIPVSVRHSALGGVQTAASGELNDMFANPASLSTMLIPELVVAHDQAVVETKYDSIGFGLPHKNQAYALSGRYLDYGSGNRLSIDSNGDPVTDLGEFHYSTLLIQGGWAWKMSPRLSVGAAGKAWSDKRDQTSASSWAGDLGILWTSLLPRLDFGLAARNLGPSVDGFDLPRTVSMGAAFHLAARNSVLQRTSLFVDGDLVSTRDQSVRTGLEFDARNFWLRAGYTSQDVSEALGHFTFGGGLRIKGLRLDYAWISQGDLGDQQKFSLTIGFGLTPAERERAAQSLDAAMQKQSKDNAERAFAAGQALFDKGDYEDAKEQLAQAIVWDPTHDRAKALLKTTDKKIIFNEANEHYILGKELAGKEQWLESAFQLQQTLKLLPNHVEAQQALKIAQKRIAAQRGRTTSARDPIEEMYNRGVEYYLQERYEPAIREWKRAEALAPDFPNLREYIEKAKNKKLSQEVAALRKDKSEKQGVAALSQQAYTFYSLGQTDKAARLWERVLMIDPDNKDAASALAKAKQKLALAQPTVTTSKQNQADDLSVQALREYAQGNLERAAELWREALKLDPGNLRVKKNLERAESELAGKRSSE